MVVKNFVFRQDWVGRKVAGMKKNLFLPILTLPGPIFLALKSPNKDFLIKHFSEERLLLSVFDFKTD